MKCCQSCGSEHLPFVTCVCGQYRCQICHEESPMHLKHERDFLRERVAELEARLRDVTGSEL